MALITSLQYKKRNARPQTKQQCTYFIIEENGEKFLQIDTYGTDNREMCGTVSQTMRFTQAGIDQLKEIIEEHFKASFIK